MLSYEFPPYVGGESAYTEGLSRYLVSMGHEVTIITSDIAGRGDKMEFPEGLEVIYVPTMRRHPMRIESYRRGARSVYSKLRNKFDVLHQTSDYIIPPFEDKDLPSILTIHHPFAAERTAVSKYFSMRGRLWYASRRYLIYLEEMQKVACRRADRIIAVSRFSGQMAIKRYGIEPKNISIIPNAIFPGEFENTRIDFDEYIKILFVGRLDYNKGVFDLINSISPIKEEIQDGWRLLIVGSGPLSTRSRQLVEKHGLSKHVKFLGFTERGDLLEIYQNCDLLVLPSLMEGFGIVLIEAMACSKPCVSTICGGTVDVVDHEKTGFLVPTRATGEMTRNLLQLLENPGLRSRLGRQGRKKVKRYFQWNIVAPRVAEIYEELVK